MTDQLGLFGTGPRGSVTISRQQLPPHRHESETSRAAAESVAPRAPQQAEEVWRFLKAKGGATQRQVADGLGLDWNVVNARFGDLRTAGRVRNTGRTIVAESGRSHHVWEAISEPMVGSSTAPVPPKEA